MLPPDSTNALENETLMPESDEALASFGVAPCADGGAPGATEPARSPSGGGHGVASALRAVGLSSFPLRSQRQVATLRTMLDATADALRARLPRGCAPRVLLTLGSGLGGLADAIEGAVAVPYAELPHMVSSTAPGHAGRFVAGRIDGVDVLCMQGRLHPYEGCTPLEVTYPLRIAARLGVGAFVVTNATGAINAAYRPGQVVTIADHINLTGTNPLIGANDEDEGPRFPDMTHAYDPRLRALARQSAEALGYDLREGVYVGLCGPSFETPAEIRAFRTLGADLVGMSTVWEVIVAAHLGLPCLGLSLATNMAAGMLETPVSVEEINRAAEAGAADMQAIVRGVLTRL